MTQAIIEGNLKFTFDDKFTVEKYDEWPFYRKHFLRYVEGTKAVDILCITDDTAWLIEIKDYGKHDKTSETPLEDVMFLKARDSITGLAIACLNGNDEERSLGRMVFGRHRWKFVLHLERSDKMTNMSSIYVAVQKKVRVIDYECVVMDMQTTRAVPWTVERIE